jgi:predicted Zn finger-like uncharacterized protein
MLITCPNCATSYDVSAASLGAEGRSVKCVRCQEVWFATPSAPPLSAADEGVASAAAASAQYRRAGPAAPGHDPESPADDFGVRDDASSIDPNLAARAVDRQHVEYDDPPPLGAGPQVGGVDEAAGLAAHLADHEAPPLAPDAGEVVAISAALGPGEDIESIAARRTRRAKGKREGGRLRPSVATVIVALFAANAVLLGWRTDVVRLMPQTASLFAAIGLPVNLRGVAFSDVTTATEASEGVPVLLVKGRITNIAHQPREVPRLRFAMRNAAGNEVYAWTSMPAKAALAPGEAESFETRLASPPADGQAVVVRFFTRRDIVGDAR